MDFASQKPLYEQIYENLRDKINREMYPVGSKLPTEKELTQIYKVSRITIQKAVNLLAAEGLVKRRSGVGTTILKREKIPRNNTLLGLVVPGILESFGAELLVAMAAETARYGYSLIIKFSQEDEQLETKCVQELLDLPVRGIFINPLQRSFYDPLLMQYILDDYPIVVMDKEFFGIDELFVGSDHLDGARFLAKMIEKLGHTNLGVISYRDISNTTLRIRQDAFVQVYAHTDTPLKANTFAKIIETTYRHHDDDAALNLDIAHIKQFILKKKPTCLVVLDSYLGALTREAINELHLKVPENICLAGFDMNNELNKSIRYTYVKQSEATIAKLAVKMMAARLQEKPITARVQKIPGEIVDCQTVIRKQLMHPLGR
ncbi:MAG: GntR family transcriptional regulator [Sporolactobacillus sp.]|jgi:DNA-binding LacI/PurR family transcriptional regulator|nr:GntR family transcriptional regulator [Sporolactobacillus sp.]